jgi:hypothetical protein
METVNKINTSDTLLAPLTLVKLFFKTLLLPPFGLIWGYNYIKQKDNKAVIIGIIIIAITIWETIWMTQSVIETVNTVKQQVDLQMEGL